MISKVVIVLYLLKVKCAVGCLNEYHNFCVQILHHSYILNFDPLLLFQLQSVYALYGVTTCVVAMLKLLDVAMFNELLTVHVINESTLKTVQTKYISLEVITALGKR